MIDDADLSLQMFQVEIFLTSTRVFSSVYASQSKSFSVCVFLLTLCTTHPSIHQSIYLYYGESSRLDKFSQISYACGIPIHSQIQCLISPLSIPGSLPHAHEATMEGSHQEGP